MLLFSGLRAQVSSTSPKTPLPPSKFNTNIFSPDNDDTMVKLDNGAWETDIERGRVATMNGHRRLDGELSNRHSSLRQITEEKESFEGEAGPGEDQDKISHLPL